MLHVVVVYEANSCAITKGTKKMEKYHWLRCAWLQLYFLKLICKQLRENISDFVYKLKK